MQFWLDLIDPILSLFHAVLNSISDLADLGVQTQETLEEVLNNEGGGKKGKKLDLLDMKLIRLQDFYELVVKFGINLFFTILVVRYIYYPVARRKDFLFTYILINISIFLLCFLLQSVQIQLGFALGLFAIFGIIRYRTDPIPIKEMTYLFVVIALSVLNALINNELSVAQLLFANFAVVGATYALEKIWLLRHESQKVVLYENIELIHTDRYDELIADLNKRTGLNINRIEIGKIDFLRDTATIRVYFYDDEQKGHGDDRRTQTSTS